MENPILLMRFQQQINHVICALVQDHDQYKMQLYIV